MLRGDLITRLCVLCVVSLNIRTIEKRVVHESRVAHKYWLIGWENAEEAIAFFFFDTTTEKYY